MEIDIAGRHFHVTSALKDYIADKVRKFDKYSLKLEGTHVILDVQKFHHICEIVLRGKNLRVAATGESADMYAAFDKCFDTIQLQLRRRHDKLREDKGRRYRQKSSKAQAPRRVAL